VVARTPSPVCQRPHSSSASARGVHNQHLVRYTTGFHLAPAPRSPSKRLLPKHNLPTWARRVPRYTGAWIGNQDGTSATILASPLNPRALRRPGICATGLWAPHTSAPSRLWRCTLRRADSRHAGCRAHRQRSSGEHGNASSIEIRRSVRNPAFWLNTATLSASSPHRKAIRSCFDMILSKPRPATVRASSLFTVGNPSLRPTRRPDMAG